MSPKKFPVLLALFATLYVTACVAHENGWQPTIDSANDKHVDTLKADLAVCKQLAEKAGVEGMTPKTRSRMWTDDGDMMNGSTFRRSYINCMKERKHPVIDG
jgi:hypothetical protein